MPPPRSLDSENSHQDVRGAVQSAAHCPLVAREILVPQTVGNAMRSSHSPPRQVGPVVPAEGQGLAPGARALQAGGLASVKRVLPSRGFS